MTMIWAYNFFLIALNIYSKIIWLVILQKSHSLERFINIINSVTQNDDLSSNFELVVMRIWECGQTRVLTTP